MSGATRVVGALVLGFAGAEALPHLAPNWQVIVGAMVGGFMARIVTRENLAAVAERAARRAVQLHEEKCAHFGKGMSNG